MGWREVAPGVEEIGLAYVNAFLLTGAELALIDTGTSSAGRRIRERLEAHGGTSSLRHALITHHHVDHVGPLAALAGESVTVWAHPVDAGVIRGQKARPTPDSRHVLEKAGVWAIESFGPKAKPARVDRELTDGEEIPIGEGLIAYHTPGHTAGHMSFLMPSKRLLFVGDAAANYLGRLGPPVGIYSEDHDQVRRSIAKIAALDFDIACFGHGRTLKGNACARFRTLAEKVAG